MRQFLLILLALVLATGMSACSTDDFRSDGETPEQPLPPGGNDNPGQPADPDPDNRTMKIKAGSATFTATFQDNVTAKAFKSMLPMTVNMREMNGNEKYYDMPSSLPTASSNPGTICNGDIMLYGSRTLVLFYKTFQSGYSYTKIASVDDPAGLERALGAGNVTVTFEMIR